MRDGGSFGGRLRAAMAVSAVLALALAVSAQAADERRPLQVEQLTPLDFGNLIPSPGLPGEAAVDPASGRFATHGGLHEFKGRPGRAEFLVRGEPGEKFAILLPAEIPLEGRGATVVLTDLLSIPAGEGVLGPDGTARVHLGGTLKVRGGQPSGTFRAPIDLFVEYQ